ncbi:MAG: VWA domain-containing protein [Thermoleophilia bacterium]|nr:VWA domain-containing protein [Thermoleophilia bacterium]
MNRDAPDLALDATLRAAAIRSGRARAGRIVVEPGDLRRKVREHRSPFAVAFVVDNSYSVHAERMVEKVKGLTLELLEDATGRGDRVALVAFKRGLPEAAVALPLTRSTSFASARLEAIPLSGRTPLADALRQAGRLLRQEIRKHANVVPLVVCVTDGRPTAPLRPGGDPLADALEEARALRRTGIALVVADTATGRAREAGRARELADAGDGRYLPFARLAPGTLTALLGEGA